MLLWREAPRIWEAKGYTQQTIADALEEKFGTGRKLGRTALSILVKTELEPCPPEVEQFLREELTVRDAKRWATFLATEADEPSEDEAPSSGLDQRLREGAREAASEVANTVRAWLETFGTFITFARAAFSTLTAKLDATASAVLGGLLATDARLDAANGKLDGANARLDGVARKLDGAHTKLDSHGGKLDALSSKIDTTNAKLDSTGGKLDALQAVLADMRAEQRSARHLSGTVVGVVLLVGLLLAGRQWFQAETSRAETTNATQLPQVANVLNGAMSAAEAALRAALAALDMGKKADKEFWIPKEPFPWQKPENDCDRSLGEEPINGGCWVYIYAVKPPCGKLFRHEDRCYRPVSADPTKPVGMFRVAPDQP
ncbi:MAG TPA: hypothetical protein VK447_02915 [Myxococcaceae bacterium]|nr:hypothetical protein [Myxococcaceae bacterium]